MNKKVVAGVVALAVIIVIAVLSITLTRKSPVPDTVSNEEQDILIDQINTLTDEELAEISTDASNFGSSVEDDISQDDSLFTYQ